MPFPFSVPKGYRGIGSGWGVYRRRDEILRSLGFADYQAYLRSELWAQVKSRFLSAGDICRMPECSRRASTIHHADYTEKALRGERDELMFPICQPCHRSIETIEWDGGRKAEPIKVALLTGFFRICVVCDRAKPTKGWSKTEPLCPSCLGRRAALEGRQAYRGE